MDGQKFRIGAGFLVMKIILILSFALLSSCRPLFTPDGKIPQRYLKHALKYTGPYKGQVKGVPAQFQLKVLADRTAVLNYIDVADSDILREECETQIGQLAMIRLRGKGARGVELHFALKHNCKDIQGRSLKVILSRSGKGELQVYHQRANLEQLHCENTKTGKKTCKEIKVPLDFYYKGEFKKVRTMSSLQGSLIQTSVP
jgi:hypothetical protein